MDKVGSQIYKHYLEFKKNKAPALLEKKYQELKAQNHAYYKSSEVSSNNSSDKLNLFDFIENTFVPFNPAYQVHLDIGLSDLIYYPGFFQKSYLLHGNPLPYYNFENIFGPNSIPIWMRPLIGNRLDMYELYYEFSINSFLENFFCVGK